MKNCLRSAVAFGDIQRDGESGTVKLVGEIVVTFRKRIGEFGDRRGESDGTLVDGKLLEEKRHFSPPF